MHQCKRKLFDALSVLQKVDDVHLRFRWNSVGMCGDSELKLGCTCRGVCTVHGSDADEADGIAHDRYAIVLVAIPLFARCGEPYCSTNA